MSRGRYYVHTLLLCLEKRRRKFVWKFECVDTEPTPPPSDGGGGDCDWRMMMTVQGDSLVTFLFSPWLYRHTHSDELTGPFSLSSL
jgi:hypothetical protein